MYNIPSLLFADKNGNIYDHPTLKMTGKTNSFDIVPYETELTELPKNHKIKFLEGAVPLGYDQERAKIVEFEGGFPVYITTPKGYLRVLMPSFKAFNNNILQPDEYTAVGFMEDTFYFPGIKADVLTEDISEKNGTFKDKIVKYEYANNKLVNYLIKMSKKTFGEIETLTPFGNEIIFDFRYFGETTPSEVYELLNIYSKEQKFPVVTFKNIALSDNIFEIFVDSLKLTSKLDSLTINIQNPIVPSNQMKKILEYPPNSITIPFISSLNSLISSKISDTIGLMKNHNESIQKLIELFQRYGTNVFVDLLILPGFTDTEGNIQNLVDFLNTYRINSLKLSNMKINPNRIFEGVESLKEELLGIRTMLKKLKKECKELKFSVFVRHKDFFLKDSNLPDLKRRRK